MIRKLLKAIDDKFEYIAKEANDHIAEQQAIEDRKK
jgi:hypothetical protein